ncbi:MAG: bifunctional folylpolyglutamate synthase/dihydrofolate synthase [Fluviicola sp.]|nr:bifunctional folylpolyglutamate synthase/dihydrofolate synthase [Fluviicola sp.]
MKSKRNSQYQEQINWLFQQFPSYQKIGSKAYKPTLENIQAITERIDSPEKHLKFVHVAGSNGKGSTCSMLASILTEAGYKVGLFTSPHIKDFTERIRINGECIPQENVVAFIKKIKQEDFCFAPSFFEVTFAMALNHFKEKKCDICIIETGLGGRLDATNIVSPILSAITNISLEHTAILGDTLEKIAIEKAGIIKENVPVALGRMSEDLLQQFSTIAEGRNASVHLTSIKEHPFELPLLGEYQQDNFQLVLNCLKQLHKLNFLVSGEAIQQGLNKLSTNTGFLGRLQVIEKNPLLIFDVSHNEAGISATLKTVGNINKGQLHIIFGSSNDKDVAQSLQALPKVAKIYFTEFSNERSCSLSHFRKEIEQLNLKDVAFFDKAVNALNAAKSSAKEKDSILVMGSFFLVGELM